MAANLQSGFHNNINVVTIRGNARSFVHTDRAIDFNGDGTKESVTSVGAPTDTGAKVQQTVTVNQGSARTVVEGSAAESVNLPSGDTDYTLGIN
jgi:hypothetical protein